MAYLKGAKGSQLLIKRRTSAEGITPKVFGAPCSINADREFALEVNVNESVAIDCANPEAPQWVERTPDTLSAQITGGGRMHTPEYGEYWDATVAGIPEEYQVVTNVTAADGGDIVQGYFLITNLSKSGARGGDLEISITLQSSGPLTREDVA